MRKELEWIRRQPKARGTKAKYRIDAFEETKAKANSGKVTDKLDLQVKMTRQGGKVLNIKNISKKFGELEVIKSFSYIFKKGEKIGIIGKNGTGKTTFINILTGNLKPDKGDRDIGENTVFGYFKQEEVSFNPEQRLIDAVKDIAEYIEVANGQKISASQFLKLFLFPPEVQYTQIGKLSGGEKKRLQLLMVLIKNPNFLILDEPTNDLDLATLNVLEDFLLGYKGTLIIVSHDRYFMDRMVDHLFVFKGNGEIQDFPGNYTDYRESLLQEKNSESEYKAKIEPQKPKAEIPKPGDSQSPKRKLSFKEKFEFEQLEKEIEQMEAQKTSLIEKLNMGGLGHEELMKISTKIKELSDSIDEKSMRWLELGELL
jgi:ATP-binding cassette subfamily F protein uup